MDTTKVIYSTVGAVGCSTNGFAIFILLHLQNRFSTTNLLILNQCIIDLLSSLMALCLFLDADVMTRLPESNAAAEFVCKFWSSKYIFWSCTYSSTANLVVLTFDRYFAVMFAVKYNIIKEKIWIKVLLLVIPWTCGFAFLGFWSAIHTVSDGVCIQIWPSVEYQKAFGLMTGVYILVIPVSVMLIVYLTILRALRNRVGDGSSAVSASSAARRMNIIKTMVIVSVTYVICWTPNQIAFVNFTLGGGLDINEPVYYTVVAMSLCNICINPIIYTFKYNDFKVGVRKTLPCLKSIFTPQEHNPIGTTPLGPSNS
ncbi:neuropeptides B/W receptor type 2-like [Anneissia japonica]|uniref:neuropeptides B/W receptor type 2-like n=1 Tax=Anneissia japonica TaxID=1529436 RepID=UPI00142595C0|nr:neuropeptides B/W receptor type 2-like [Anneissia japonica]